MGGDPRGPHPTPTVLSCNLPLVWKWLTRATALQTPATLGTDSLDTNPGVISAWL